LRRFRIPAAIIASRMAGLGSPSGPQGFSVPRQSPHAVPGLGRRRFLRCRYRTGMPARKSVALGYSPIAGYRRRRTRSRRCRQRSRQARSSRSSQEGLEPPGVCAHRLHEADRVIFSGQHRPPGQPRVENGSLGQHHPRSGRPLGYRRLRRDRPRSRPEPGRAESATLTTRSRARPAPPRQRPAHLKTARRDRRTCGRVDGWLANQPPDQLRPCQSRPPRHRLVHRPRRPRARRRRPRAHQPTRRTHPPRQTPNPVTPPPPSALSNPRSSTARSTAYRVCPPAGTCQPTAPTTNPTADGRFTHQYQWPGHSGAGYPRCVALFPPTLRPATGGPPD
jgi:hypothetical protein